MRGIAAAVRRWLSGWGRAPRAGPAGGGREPAGATPEVSAGAPHERPPDWAAFMGSDGRFEAFLGAVGAELERRGIRAAIEDGWVRPLEPPYKGSRWGLSNLGQECALEDEGRWPALVRAHFERLTQALDDREAAGVEPFEAVADRLALRLWDRASLGTDTAMLVVREDVPGILSVLCVDEPESIRTVTREQAAAWGGADELFERALANVLAMPEPQIERLEMEHGPMYAVVGESFYVAPRMLRPERLAALMGRRGAFLSAPVRNAILGVPFDTTGAAGLLSHLIQLTHMTEQRGPGSVSPRVYWYEHRVWTEIPCQVGEGRVQVFPPEALVEALNALGAEEA